MEKLREQIGKGGDQYLPVFLSEMEMREIGKQVDEFRGKIFKKNISRGFAHSHVSANYSSASAAMGKRSLSPPRAKRMRSNIIRNSLGSRGWSIARRPRMTWRIRNRRPTFSSLRCDARPFGAGAGDRDRDTPYDIEAAKKIDLRRSRFSAVVSRRTICATPGLSRFFAIPLTCWLIITSRRSPDELFCWRKNKREVRVRQRNRIATNELILRSKVLTNLRTVL